MRDINLIVVHCSATPEGRDVSTETIRGWHVNERKWSDIGYHYVIELNGKVKNGRPLERAGAHVRGFNKNSIGICYVGGMTADMKEPKDTRTKAQKESLLNLILELKLKFPNAVVRGHNDFASKACPSFDASSEYKNVKFNDMDVTEKFINKYYN